MVKRQLTTRELEEHLERQLRFLEASSAAFDNGYEDEAVRLSLGVRILLHDTNNSRSLLSLLSKKNIQFADTAFEPDSDSVAAHGGLVFIAMGAMQPRFVAGLDDVPSLRWISFDEWWNAPVFVDQKRNILTRKNLVLIAANQDGGAHVDPDLDEAYYELTRNNSFGWFSVEKNASKPIAGAERAAIRQIAHEVLKTLRPGYTKGPQHQGNIIIGGVSVNLGSSPAHVGPQRPAQSAKVGRNKPCPCGSGRKYKHCCGALVR